MSIRQSSLANFLFRLRRVDHSVIEISVGFKTFYSTGDFLDIEDIQVFGVNMSFISLSEVNFFYIS